MSLCASRLFATYGTVYFLDCLICNDSCDDVLFTDDLTLAYYCLLPMEVHGTLYGDLGLVTKHTDIPLHTVSTAAVHTACLSVCPF